MFNKILSVTYIDTKNCFCALPVNIANAKPQTFVRLTYGENKATYLSTAANQFILQQNSIGIPTLLARLLGIEENSEISVIEVAHMPDVTALTISPLKKDDFEVLEAFAQNIQSTLLDQIKVVHLNQPIVIWIGSHISVNVLINAVEPISPGCLCNLSEVTIKDPKLQTLASQNRAKLQHMKHFLKNLDRNLNNSSNTFIKLFAHNSRCSLTARLVPLADLKLPIDKIFSFNVYISKRNFNEEFLKAKPHLCRISPLNANLGIDSTDCCVQLCFLEDCNLPSQENDFLYVSEELLQKLWCNYFSRVALQTIQTASFVNEIQVVAKRTCLNRNQVLEEFKKYIADNTNNNDIVVLNADVVCNFGKFVRCSLKFLPDNYKYCIADDEFVRNCKFSLHVDHYESPPALQSITNVLKYSETCNFGDIIQNVMFNFANRADFENVLITGKAGTGKSVLCKVLEGKLKEFPLYIYTERINCKEVKGKTVESLFKILACTFAKLVLHQPSCLILDDLHVLCEVVNGDELSTPNSLYFNRLSETLSYFLSNMVEFNAIRVLATAESCAKLNRNIYTSRGDHLFKNVFDIEELNKADRAKFLKHYFTIENTLEANKLNFEEIALKTDSFVAQDLICLAEKTIFEALKENPNGNSCIEMHHFENAFKTFNILALNDVNLSSAGTKTFEDIGGLADIKKVLVETLIWPVKYSSVFAEAPLRLQSGLLLYGPPGTGKTLLAGAAAKHCGLRLISIKGPELLSKYIGASEQAVRDVFEKAQSAKPCILFFDEFDSLAPRRGHDNTGVTDRVVNQLLTQLDGVESLTGVCILAATSRPDLLDPALLRPGRLDRQLLCPIPDYHTRIEILKVLTKTIDLEEDVDFEKIASLTEGFSGADLQGVLYVTQVSSVDLLSNDRDSKTFRLSQDILEKTVQSTRPSLTLKDKLRYETIYSKFQGGSSLDDFKSGTKSTLA